MSIEHAYTPLPLNPLEAQFLNLLLTRDWPCSFDLFGVPCSFTADPWQTPFVPACGLDLDVQGEPWRVLFSSARLLELHPAGARVADTPGLPEGLRLALFELSLAPALNFLTDFFGLNKQPAILAESNEPPGGFACSVPLALRLPDETVAVTLYIPGRASAEALLLRLGQEKRKRNPTPALLLSVALETGSMLLSVPELSALRNEDILLPAAYPGAQGELCLRLSPELGIRCALADGRATVLGVEHSLPGIEENETRRMEMPDTPPDTAPQENAAAPEAPAPPEAPVPENRQPMPGTSAPAVSPDALPDSLLGTLEVAVTFELDRRLMSITEIAALTPGYTFTLPVEANGPVTVRANGKSLGTGRLVDVGGVLGVQLVNLEREQ